MEHKNVHLEKEKSFTDYEEGTQRELRTEEPKQPFADVLQNRFS